MPSETNTHYYVKDLLTGKTLKVDEIARRIEERGKEESDIDEETVQNDRLSGYYATDPGTGERVTVEEMYRRMEIDKESKIFEEFISITLPLPYPWIHLTFLLYIT